MTKAEIDKFRLENVDLQGFELEKKKTAAAHRGQDELEFEATGGGVVKGVSGLRKAGSMPKLRVGDAEVDPQTTEGILMAAKGKLLQEGHRRPADGDKDDDNDDAKGSKLKPLVKKTASIQALYQSQEIATEFNMKLPPKEGDEKTKVVLQLPGQE